MITVQYKIVLKSSNFKLIIGNVANSSTTRPMLHVLSQILNDPGHDLILLLLTAIILRMDKVWIGASKVKSSVQSKGEKSVKKSCREDEYCGF